MIDDYSSSLFFCFIRLWNSYLQSVEVNSRNVELIEMAPILINGLSKLSFVALSGNLETHSNYQEKISCPFRTEMVTEGINAEDTLFIWL